MALKNKYFNPQIYQRKLYFICVLILVDIILNSFTQYLDFGSTNIMSKYSVYANGYQKDSGDISYALLA